MNCRSFWIGAVVASVLSLLLLIGTASYAAAAEVKSTDSLTVTKTLNSADFYPVGYNDGVEDGILQCQNTSNIHNPPDLNKHVGDSRAGYYEGFIQGVKQGYRQQGCIA